MSPRPDLIPLSRGPPRSGLRWSGGRPVRRHACRDSGARGEANRCLPLPPPGLRDRALRQDTALDERQYDRGRGPCLNSVDGGVPVHIPHAATLDRWRGWAAEAASQGLRSSLSVPVPIQREIAAAINIDSTGPQDPFDDNAVELAQTFAGYAGVAPANMHPYQAQGRVAEQLQQAMHSRAAIEQAKGIVMDQRRCGPEEAFDILVRLSQDTNRKLRDVAQALVDQTRTDSTG